MSSLVTRKKSELAAKLQRLQERHDALAAALDSSGGPAGGAGGGGDGGVVTEAQWKAKYETVKAQLPAYKAMKKELAELEAEVGRGRVAPRWLELQAMCAAGVQVQLHRGKPHVVLSARSCSECVARLVPALHST